MRGKRKLKKEKKKLSFYNLNLGYPLLIRFRWDSWLAAETLQFWWLNNRNFVIQSETLKSPINVLLIRFRLIIWFDSGGINYFFNITREIFLKFFRRLVTLMVNHSQLKTFWPISYGHDFDRNLTNNLTTVGSSFKQ